MIVVTAPVTLRGVASLVRAEVGPRVKLLALDPRARPALTRAERRRCCLAARAVAAAFYRSVEA